MDEYLQKTFKRAVGQCGFNQSNEEKLTPKDDGHIIIPNNQKLQSTADQTSLTDMTNLTIHQGTLCDVCGISPIIGSRFMCLLCHNFDLCEQCECLSSRHPADHPLIKVKVPLNLKMNYNDHFTPSERDDSAPDEQVK